MIRDGRVEILDNITLDFSLPKHIKPIDEKVDIGNSFTMAGGFNPSLDDIVASDPTAGRENPQMVLDYLNYLYDIKPDKWLAFKIWWHKTFKMKKRAPRIHRIPASHLKAFFDGLKDNVKEIDKTRIDRILSKYESVLKNAEENRQKALIEKIKDYSAILAYELTLSTTPFKKYLTESDLLSFHKAASKHGKYNTNLKLTYIKNFVKIIPEEVTEMKRQADEFKIFDNYAVLHYDPKNNSTEDTKEEKEGKKDPILFGLIQGSRNLYYIGDWVDDYCDLTLDVIIEKLGKKKADSLSTNQIESNIQSL